MTPKRLAWLFDVDGTLLVTEGAAHQAFVLAVRDVLGIDDDLADIAFAGRTEPLIVADILTKHERRFVDGEEPRFWNAVFDHMRQVFPPTRGRLLPGVPELLEAVEGERDWVSALLTGNMTQMARIKLMRFGIVDRFAFGAFGEEARDRNALAQVAVERAGRHGVPPSAASWSATPSTISPAPAPPAPGWSRSRPARVTRRARRARRRSRARRPHRDERADRVERVTWRRVGDAAAGASAPARRRAETARTSSRRSPRDASRPA